MTKNKISMEKLRQHILNELVLVVDGVEFVLHPAVGDKLRLLTELGKRKDGTHMQVFTDYLKELIQKESEDYDEHTVDAFIDTNLDELVKQLSIKFKMASEDTFKQEEKNLI